MSVFRFCVSQPHTDKEGFKLLRGLPEVQIGASAIMQSLWQGIPIQIVLDYQKICRKWTLSSGVIKCARHIERLILSLP